jgi:hypothetical protein
MKTKKQRSREVRPRTSLHPSVLGPGLQRREDLYCRIDDCIGSFKSPRVCKNHCKRHFSLVWRCPGPCQTESKKAGWFARDETLGRHLLSPRCARCKDKALQLLGLESISATGHGSQPVGSPVKQSIASVRTSPAGVWSLGRHWGKEASSVSAQL